MIMAKILIVEDAEEFHLFLSTVLKEHEIIQIDSYAQAIRVIQAEQTQFDLVLLDIKLADGNGMEILPLLKNSEKYNKVPVIIISGDSNVLTKVAAFGVGADDYITKPPDISELRARISAKLRLSLSLAKEVSNISFGQLTIDTNKMSVVITSDKNKLVHVNLTPLEFKILSLLMKRPNIVFSRELIIDCVWGVGRHITARTVDAHISHLREKIDKSNVKIETVLSFGYKLVNKDGP